MKPENNNDIELKDESELLEPTTKPYLWLGLLLIPVIFLIIGEIRSVLINKPEPAIEQTQKRPETGRVIEDPIVQQMKLMRQQKAR